MPPAALGRPIRLLLLLAAGCGAAASYSSGVDAPEARALTVRVWAGTLRVRNGRPARFEATVRGSPGRPLARILRITEAPDAVHVAVAEDAQAFPLDLDVVAPPGIALSVVGRDAAIDLTGEWMRLQAKSQAGAITARVERAEAGEIWTSKGRIEFAPRVGPSGDFAAKSVAGDVAIRLPPGWRGRVHLSTQAGRLDVPPQPGLRTKWGEGGRSLLGFAGPDFTEAEREAELADRGSPAAVWGNSALGTVSLRLGE